jgi:hypothetical protein
MASEIGNIFLTRQDALDYFVLISFTTSMSDEIRLPAMAEPVTAPGIQHHFCEHPGCRKHAGWGFAKPKQAPHWFCFEHRNDGELYL